ncbi:hypothetical protein AKJ40_03900 [candidate division MSBL1 archaeon SCGC-AAA259M10]|uniref:Uncharacterized protein n=1 Tax=candidate division MSBL1 archaeon SCGC-AAA259M10 TaxID=1698270 RepID=A0A133UY79_9EURY|nr:hypothetical protein AKJ40_03900 [candidate division MSBL1 archaeon SCGC-AAA259M10]
MRRKGVRSRSLKNFFYLHPAWTEFKRKFRRNGEGTLGEYLEEVKEILQGSFPMEDEIVKLPRHSRARKKHREVLEGLDGIPDDEVSREVFVRMRTGEEYREFRRTAKREIRTIEKMEEFEEKKEELPKKRKVIMLVEEFF